MFWLTDASGSGNFAADALTRFFLRNTSRVSTEAGRWRVAVELPGERIFDLTSDMRGDVADLVMLHVEHELGKPDDERKHRFIQPEAYRHKYEHERETDGMGHGTDGGASGAAVAD
jgi:hypothetical protein